MTGIERLVDIVTDGPYSGGMIHISVHKLREICDQIEAEAGVETVKSEAMEALAFVDEHGGLEKAQRELERAEAWHLDKLEMYRLCTEYGGVKELKRRLATGGCKPLLGIDGSPIVPGEVYYGQSDGKRWRIDAVGTLFAWAGLSKTARMRGEGPKRLRPEWLSRKPTAPKVLDADGVEIRAGDHVWNEVGTAFTVVAVSGKNKSFKAMRHYDRQECDGCNPSIFTHRAPVLAADGKQLEVGQTVWSAKDGTEYKVGEIRDTTDDDDEPCKIIGCSNDELHIYCAYFPPEKLTHQRPVLDADGVLCREGDEVWEVRSHRRREIVGTHYRDYETGEPLILCDGDDAIPIPATCVTHAKPEPPDSWEKWRKDFIKRPCVYCRDILGVDFDNDKKLNKAFDAQAQDMERRAKALAERGQ